MPQMGVSVAEGTIIAWRVEVGDRIEAEQTICEISTDKIDTEVPAPVSGVVVEILVPVEATVEVGVVVARIATGAATGVAADRERPAAEPDNGRPHPEVSIEGETGSRSGGSGGSPAAGIREAGSESGAGAPGAGPGGPPRGYFPLGHRLAAPP